MQKAFWNGAISFGLVHIPVELYSSEKKHELDFSMVDRRDFAPIGYKRFNKKTGEEVELDDIIKAYEYATDQYVVVSDEDLRRANVNATQTIEILGFVDAHEIPLVYYEQPYYLAPGKGGAKVYALLREALRKTQKVGIAQVVIRTRQHLVALMPIDNVIVLNTLRYQKELRPTDELDLQEAEKESAEITGKEIDMAVSLVESMAEPWDPTRYHDTYRDDVLTMVKRKVAAHQTTTITQPEEDEEALPAAKMTDLMALLKESINSAIGKSPPKSKQVRSTSAARGTSGTAKKPALAHRPERRQ